MEVGPTWMVTGSADEEVRVWCITKRTERSYRVDTTLRLVGHNTQVTCVRYGKLEVVSGDMLGRAFVWWLETGEVLRKCQIHRGPIKCMQFDATRIVSGGVDCTVCITDIGSGQVLQSLRGHHGPVLAVAFDTERIISACVDNSVKYWTWGKKMGAQNKIHILDRGQTLVDIAKIYKMKVQDIVTWNGISDLRQCYTGMSLIVAKGDPNKPTPAEASLIERERRKKIQMTHSQKNYVGIIDEHNKFPKYNRMRMLTVKNDHTSLGNRLFDKAKHDTEVFPDAYDTYTDFRSLGSRIMARTDYRMDCTAPPIIVSADNEEEWGSVANALGLAMIDLFVELQAYEIAMEQLSYITETKSFGGRIRSHMTGVEVTHLTPVRASTKKQGVTTSSSKSTTTSKKSIHTNSNSDEQQLGEGLPIVLPTMIDGLGEGGLGLATVHEGREDYGTAVQSS